MGNLEATVTLVGLLSGRVNPWRDYPLRHVDWGPSALVNGRLTADGKDLETGCPGTCSWPASQCLEEETLRGSECLGREHLTDVESKDAGLSGRMKTADRGSPAKQTST